MHLPRALVTDIRATKYDLAVVGHIVFDHISRGTHSFEPQLGSPCVYAGLAARALGASVVLGGKVGSDFSLSWLNRLKRRGLNVDYVQHSKAYTTAFRINYQDDSRTMWALSRCPSLTRRELARLPLSSALHMGPILQEIPCSLALSLAERNGIVALDPQGYMRHISRGGKIRRLKWTDQRLLKRLDVLKLSKQEAVNLIGGNYTSARKLTNLGPEVVLITRGALGTIVWSKSLGTFNVPAFKTKVRDPTGAGDALLGALLVTWVKDGDLLWSAAVGSAVASFVVENVGPADFGTPREIRKRASIVSQNTVRK